MGSSRVAWAATMVIVVVVVFIAFNLNHGIGYANGPACDDWYYFGIFEDYWNSVSVAPGMYQIIRYSAVLPWSYVAPHLSTVAFHDLKFWAHILLTSGLFTYAAIKLYGSRVGAITAILFSCSTLVLGSMSHDYVTGAGVLWASAAIAATLYGASRDNQLPGAFAVGAFYALCVYTHIPIILFIFAVPLLFFAVSKRSNPILSFVRFNIVGLVGFAVASLGLAAFSWVIGNNFYFYSPEIYAVFIAVKPGFYARPTPNNFEWFKTDTNIAFFVAAFGVSLVALARAIIFRDVDRRNLIPTLVYIPAAVMCFAWEFSGQVVLQQNVYAPWMYPVAFLACGAGLSQAPRLNIPTTVIITCLIAIALCVAATTIGVNIGAKVRYPVALAFIMFAALAIWRYSAVPLYASLAALVCLTFPTGYGALPWFIDGSNERRLYEIVSQARRFIVPNYKAGAAFWISGRVRDEFPSLPPVTIPRTFLECSAYPGAFPSVVRPTEAWDSSSTDLKTLSNSGKLTKGRRLFIIAPGDDIAAQASEALKDIGRTVRQIGEVKISDGFSVAAVDVAD
ncbi:hypothetical protein AB8B24_07985 [Tardiphaga sp. 866_E4_N2_3]|uniref:hypothetical protein n=2 Tax=Tardiphaga TaxID=1395974 RepID=UPI003F29A0F4